MNQDWADAVERAADRFDYVFGGDVAEYLVPEWRGHFREAVAPLAAECNRPHAGEACIPLGGCVGDGHMQRVADLDHARADIRRLRAALQECAESAHSQCFGDACEGCDAVDRARAVLAATEITTSL